jgi:hypothetical protein
LVRVKTEVDPTNFFRNEQSIPSLSSWWSKGATKMGQNKINANNNISLYASFIIRFFFVIIDEISARSNNI